ncbi:MAG: hypothetical protein HYV09_22610 [Deltaproteobacteria bacterium]|nr:hypothetical protein [Deltaproteobacteria bacterium]
MAAPVVVVILIVASDAGSPATQTMVTTARAALGSAVVLVQEVPAPATDEQASKVGAQVHADAVVQVTWPAAQGDGGKAHLHVRVFSQPAWTDRDLSFGSADAPTERGRAVGLAISTMVPVERPEPSEPKKPERPTELAATPAPTAPTTPTRTRPPAPRFELDAAALGTFGFVGVANGAGGELAARLAVPESFALRLGGGVRFGEMDEARASTSTTRLSGGVSVHAARVGALDVAVQVDALLLHHSVTRKASDGAHVARGRFVGAADLLGEASLRLGPRVSVFGAAGIELATGETHVVVGSESVATIPRARGIVLLGVRLRL